MKKILNLLAIANLATFTSSYAVSCYTLEDVLSNYKAGTIKSGPFSEEIGTNYWTSFYQLKNGTILAGSSNSSIYRLKSDGTIDTSSGKNGLISNGFDGSVMSFAEISPGVIYVGTATGSIYQLNADGTINTSAGENGIIQKNTFFYITAIVKISELNSFVVNNRNIYAITKLGNIDKDFPGADKETGAIFSIPNYDGWISSFATFKNGTFLVGTGSGSIYKLNSDGQIDNLIDANNKISSASFDGTVASIVELSDGTILAGTQVRSEFQPTGSIFHLTSDGKIDTSVGDGTGKVENKAFNGVIKVIYQFSDGSILLGTSMEKGDGTWPNPAGYFYWLNY